MAAAVVGMDGIAGLPAAVAVKNRVDLLSGKTHASLRDRLRRRRMPRRSFAPCAFGPAPGSPTCRWWIRQRGVPHLGQEHVLVTVGPLRQAQMQQRQGGAWQRRHQRHCRRHTARLRRRPQARRGQPLHARESAGRLDAAQRERGVVGTAFKV